MTCCDVWNVFDTPSVSYDIIWQVGGRVPVLDTLAELVTRGRSIPVHLDYLPRLESLVSEVQAWKECAANTFLCENSPYSLLEVRDLTIPSTATAHQSGLQY